MPRASMRAAKAAGSRNVRRVGCCRSVTQPIRRAPGRCPARTGAAPSLPRTSMKSTSGFERWASAQSVSSSRGVGARLGCSCGAGGPTLLEAPCAVRSQRSTSWVMAASPTAVDQVAGLLSASTVSRRARRACGIAGSVQVRISNASLGLWSISDMSITLHHLLVRLRRDDRAREPRAGEWPPREGAQVRLPTPGGSSGNGATPRRDCSQPGAPRSLAGARSPAAARTARRRTLPAVPRGIARPLAGSRRAARGHADGPNDSFPAPRAASPLTNPGAGLWSRRRPRSARSPPHSPRRGRPAESS